MVDLFNFNAPVVENKQQRVSDPNVFSPNPSKYPDKTFSCTLRFLPNPQNPNESCYQKYNVFMENPLTHKKRLVEVVNGDGLTETFFELRSSPNTILVERSDMFSRKERYVSLVTIVKCDCQPDLVGKILVWSFPRAIKKLIDEQITPTDRSEESVNPFNVVQSNYLFLHMSMQGRWPDYSGTKFGTKNSDATAVKVPMETQNGVQLVPITSDTVKNEAVCDAFRKWLENGPKLSDYAPKGYHDDDEKKFIWECISWAKNPNSQTTTAPQPSTVYNGQPAAAPVVDSFSMNQMPINAAPTAAPQMATINLGGAPTAAAALAPTAAPAAQMPSGLDDVLGGAQPQAQPSAGIAGGISLGDVLSGIM